MNRLKRVLLIFLVIGIAASSGCVYWRLLKFKGQLNDFNEHFEFTSRDGYSLIFKHPLLTGGDLDGLMEVEPSEMVVSDSLCHRIYRFLKHPPDGTSPLEYRFRFREDLLVGIDFPEQFSRLYPGETLSELLQALGSADVDKGERSTHSSRFDSKLRADLPSREQVLDVLGEPSQLHSRDGEQELIYNYRLETSTTGEKEEKRRASGVFYFEGPVGLTRLDARIGKHEMRFDIPTTESEE